jgi:hypothetical protein
MLLERASLVSDMQETGIAEVVAEETLREATRLSQIPSKWKVK